RPLSRQGFNNVAGISRLDQAIDLCFVAQDTREPLQDFDMLVGFCCDAYNEVRCITRIPGDAYRELYYCYAALFDQLAVCTHAVGNRYTVAKVGVGYLLAIKHTGNVACFNASTIDE